MRITCPKTTATRLGTACAPRLLPLLLLLTLPFVAQAQFNYTTTNGSITITGYTGPGGAVIIPDRINGLPVTSIGDDAFASYPRLTEVTLPNSVTNLGHNAFAGCDNLTGITVDASNPVYSSVDGVLFNKSQTTLVQCPGGKTGSYTVPISVTNIGNGAFGGCYRLTSITIGTSVITIGDWAFANCNSLTSVTIPDSVTSIGTGAFNSSYSVTNVTIGSSVTSIGTGAFYWCRSLTAITVDALNSSYSSVAGVLFNKSQTTLIQYPLGQTRTSYTIPNSVTSIGGSAFADCGSLSNVTIPDSVTSIGEWAFYYCGSLSYITIGNGVTSIAEYAFYYCTSLTAINVDPLNPFYSSLDGVLFDKSQTTLIQCPGGKAGGYTIPNSVSNIGVRAFDACNKLTSVTIPDSVTSIGYEAFMNCTSLSGITIGNSLTSIGREAFWQCTSLTNLIIPNSVTSIGDWAFSWCYWLTVYFKGNAPSLGGTNVFTYASNSTVDLKVYYVLGTTGWGLTFGGRPTAPWIQVPTIQTSPQTQTAEAGSAVGLRGEASSPLPLLYLWYFNNTNLITCSTNRELELTNLQFDQSGAYSVMVSNALGAVASSPAMLNVIAAIEHRLAAGVQVMGEAGSVLNVDYADSLSATPHWLPLDTVSLVSTSQYCLDVSQPLPPHRFYRAWQAGTPSVIPSLSLLAIAPAITLTGTIGHSVRLDYINQFGPTDAWVTLATVTLTNTSQLYFDTSAPGQPDRLYRVVPSP